MIQNSLLLRNVFNKDTTTAKHLEATLKQQAYHL